MFEGRVPKSGLWFSDCKKGTHGKTLFFYFYVLLCTCQILSASIVFGSILVYLHVWLRSLLIPFVVDSGWAYSHMLFLSLFSPHETHDSLVLQLYPNSSWVNCSLLCPFLMIDTPLDLVNPHLVFLCFLVHVQVNYMVNSPMFVCDTIVVFKIQSSGGCSPPSGPARRHGRRCPAARRGLKGWVKELRRKVVLKKPFLPSGNLT